MSVTWLKYKTKEILLVDYSNLETENEMIENIETAVFELKKKNTKALILSDFSNTTIGPKFMEKAKKYGKEVIKPLSEKGAIIGIEGVKKILLKAYNSFSDSDMKPFSNKKEALNYLVDS